MRSFYISDYFYYVICLVQLPFSSESKVSLFLSFDIGCIDDRMYKFKNQIIRNAIDARSKNHKTHIDYFDHM